MFNQHWHSNTSLKNVKHSKFGEFTVKGDDHFENMNDLMGQRKWSIEINDGIDDERWKLWKRKQILSHEGASIHWKMVKIKMGSY